MALAHLWQAGLPWEGDLPPLKALSPTERSALQAMLDRKLNSPPTSSMGRLFDAASALLGVRQVATYEGAGRHRAGSPGRPARSRRLSLRAARFHNGVANMVVAVCRQLRDRTGLNAVALSGGVWQNMSLLAPHARLA
jgi:hydrogenase maturation protein HypF